MIDRKKHRQEVESLKADNRQKEMNLSKDYVTEWRTYIAEPLQREVNELRQEVAELRYAIQRISASATVLIALTVLCLTSCSVSRRASSSERLLRTEATTRDTV